jgi:hypothetical protein
MAWRCAAVPGAPRRYFTAAVVSDYHFVILSVNCRLSGPVGLHKAQLKGMQQTSTRPRPYGDVTGEHRSGYFSG